MTSAYQQEASQANSTGPKTEKGNLAKADPAKALAH
jgi:hypothetical protein